MAKYYINSLVISMHYTIVVQTFIASVTKYDYLPPFSDNDQLLTNNCV